MQPPDPPCPHCFRPAPTGPAPSGYHSAFRMSLGGANGPPVRISDGGVAELFLGYTAHDDMDSGDALDLVGDLAQDVGEDGTEVGGWAGPGSLG